MAEKPPAFVVVDRRKFTAEGEMREPAPESNAEPVRKPEPEVVRESEAEPGKVITMPLPATEAGANDLADEDLAGTLEPTGTDERLQWASDEPGTNDGSENTLDDSFQDGLGDDLDAPMGAPRSAEETAAQAREYQESSQRLDSMLAQANPGMQQPGVVAFEHVIQSFYLSAIMAMGAGTQPGEKPRIDILGARQSIDMLNVLEEKTRGNLSPQETQLLQGITFELRMMFLELTNAISRQAHQPGAVPPGSGLR